MTLSVLTLCELHTEAVWQDKAKKCKFIMERGPLVSSLSADEHREDEN